jgi:hypothetical protein
MGKNLAFLFFNKSSILDACLSLRPIILPSNP